MADSTHLSFFRSRLFRSLCGRIFWQPETFTGNGRVDLVVAARGGNALYVLPGDGKGNFGAAQIFDVSGKVTALAGGRLEGERGRRPVGICGAGSSSSVRLEEQHRGNFDSTPAA